MPILQQRDRETIQRRFDIDLKRDVNITLYTHPEIGLFIPGRECRSCGPTQELMEEVSSLSPKIYLQVVDFYKNLDEASSRGIERIPALIFGRDSKENVRFYGMPSGLEFALLLDTIIASSEKRSSLQLETRRQLKALAQDAHIRVFVTPTCQYCPALAHTAHAMAIESPKVTTDVVEIQEFPNLARLYRVMGVPKTVINDTVQFTGGVTEQELLRHVLQAVGTIESDEGSGERVSDQTTPYTLA